MRNVAPTYLLPQNIQTTNTNKLVQMGPPNDNNGTGFASSSGSSSWHEHESNSQSFHVEASMTRTVEIQAPQSAQFVVQRQVVHPGAFVQVAHGHHHIGGGLNHDHTNEDEAMAREWITQQQFQQDQLHQQEMEMELEMQYNQNQAQIQEQMQGSHYQNSHDQYMAGRQLQIEQLSIQERELQEQWAQNQISVSGCCTQGFAWSRDGDGYRCMGRNHYITDALLAEGKGGWYLRSNQEQVMHRNAKEKWEGPMYTLQEELEFVFSQPPQLIKYAGESGGSNKRGWSRKKRRG